MKPRSGDDQGKYRIKVLHKAFALLDLFNSDVEELSTPEITEQLGYTQTTVFRIIANLEEAGYLEKNRDSGKYRLGIKLFLLGSRVKPYRYLKSAAKPLLEKLNHQTGETVHLAVLHKYQVLYLDKIESSQTVRVVVSQVGHKLPAHCSGVGKVLLANLPQDEVKEAVEESGLPSFTRNTITTWNQLKVELENTRERGFAVDNEEIELGLTCVAAPVFVDNRVVAALSVSVPKERFEKASQSLTDLVVQTARELSDVLEASMVNLRSSAA
eukprot:TRINITY_DN64777_c0_g1_i1.p2 TRINITY_DN64777_c0_g1~~TRINITY_DN64777_c0_g1_i1.p2  ORF type:complete len:270 (-),score=96.34 TRINITY_DN64777_c0_g1_i1:452-1261(-)